MSWAENSDPKVKDKSMHAFKSKSDLLNATGMFLV